MWLMTSIKNNEGLQYLLLFLFPFFLLGPPSALVTPQNSRHVLIVLLLFFYSLLAVILSQDIANLMSDPSHYVARPKVLWAEYFEYSSSKMLGSRNLWDFRHFSDLGILTYT